MCFRVCISFLAVDEILKMFPLCLIDYLPPPKPKKKRLALLLPVFLIFVFYKSMQPIGLTILYNQQIFHTVINKHFFKCIFDKDINTQQ